MEQIARWAQFARSTSYSCLSVSYERGSAQKAEQVDALAAFAGISAPQAARQAAVEGARPGTLRYLAETRAKTVESQIDRVDCRIEGWLRYPHQPLRRVAFTVLVDDVPVCDGISDRFRADLKDAFASDGCRALIAIPRHLLDGRKHRLSIAVAGEEDCAIANNAYEWLLPET